MGQKLILPAEVKVCATCSYWDGDRKVDEELALVVVDDCADGECLVRGCARDALRPTRNECDCPWEHLSPDEVEAAQAAAREAGLPAAAAPEEGARAPDGKGPDDKTPDDAQ